MFIANAIAFCVRRIPNVVRDVPHPQNEIKDQCSSVYKETKHHNRWEQKIDDQTNN
jgi:hypothetical protein